MAFNRFQTAASLLGSQGTVQFVQHVTQSRDGSRSAVQQLGGGFSSRGGVGIARMQKPN